MASNIRQLRLRRVRLPVTALQRVYRMLSVYRVSVRVFAEHFRLEQEQLRVKEVAELGANNLPSPDDLEAIHRENPVRQGNRRCVGDFVRPVW